MDLVIVGAGGHAHVVVDILLCCRDQGHPVAPVGLLDDDPSRRAGTVLGLPVLSGLAGLDDVDHDGVVVAVGDNRARERLDRTLRERGERLVCAIHPGATVGRQVRLGDGSMVCGGVVVNAAAAIGDSVILNTSCSVDHHCRIGDYAHIAPGARLGGEVSVGDGALVGLGAIILPGRRVGRGSTVGAGAVVAADVPDGATVVGVPARPARKGQTARQAAISAGPVADTSERGN